MNASISKILSGLCLVVALCCMLLLLSSGERNAVAAATEAEAAPVAATSSTTTATSNSSEYSNFEFNVYPIQMPAEMYFGGERVPLEDFEVRERIDRELMVNTFWHSSTMRMIKLSHRYFPVIEEILQREGMPDDLKYVAVAESGLDNVGSPAGAKGFWQFLKSTGQQYGLEINSEVDERYHLEKATVAACKYFRKANERFGSYSNAAASYNMGMSGLSNQMKRQKNQNYYDLLLNSETKRYVPRILALKEIINNPSAYGFKVEDHQKYPPVNSFREILVDKSIPDLADFAIEQGITYWLRDNKLTVLKNKYKIKIPI